MEHALEAHATLVRLVLARFCAAHNQLPAQEFFVVQFLYCALGFLDGLHLHKGEPFRALIVPIAYHLCVLNVANAVEQFEKIAFGGVEGQVADVKARRSDLDWLRFA